MASEIDRKQAREMQNGSKGFSGRLRERLITVERRDWELWVLATSAVAILGVGFFFLLIPPIFFGQETIRIEAALSPQLGIGLLVLVLLLIAYLVHGQLQIRRLRHQSTLEALTFEIAHAQLLVDPLTKALTRASIEEVLAREISRVQRKQSTLVFLYIDVDHFKQANTQFGHLAGDLILAEIGGLLKQSIRGCDFAIRMGGDEFLLALVDTDLTGAQVVKDRIELNLAEWNRNSPVPGFLLSLSMGVQEFDGTSSLDQVLAKADSKMYTEKQARV